MTGPALLNDCFLHDKDRLRHQEALDILKSRVSRVTETEIVRLEEAYGRIAAQPLKAPRNIPLADNSAVDGYAFRHADHEEAGGFFPLQNRVSAGHPSETALAPWAAMQIFTGAVMPEGADTVAMQEDCERHTQDGREFVIVPQGLKPGANCRKAGEDVSEGTEILSEKSWLRPQDLAGIASTGTAELSVFKKLRVALVSTGDELRRPGKLITVGDVYDSNHFLLRGLAQSLPVDIEDLGILKDDGDLVEAILRDAAERFDVILTTGGASRGEEDHVLAALDRLGQRHMWQLAIKPGRPMMFGQIGNCTLLGLPGNPVAAMVCFLLYARPVMSVLAGGPFLEPQRFQMPAGFDVPKKKPDRREFYRGFLKTEAGGTVTAHKFERDGSGLISGLRAADGLIEIPEETVSVRKGDTVTFLPFSGMGIL
ncbi:molybdopterin molybdenumtransferase MoeA [Roseibium denhamense]|uniref:Molybdopterin molybdenumtransferase n=1 Tax=Roseibium denhamense TaxID=76305 RepID=A0ABY1NTP8_9HYPH|nr:gephyrin-like molybdotransferase Glp [Roseibium denhamense]MTI08134.1 molybdopterin molybdenumtransferase MoeA [Roseibium denhamense]SMP16658.1 molybdopterin molybdochelatase [Roseibium denhamense]